MSKARFTRAHYEVLADFVADPDLRSLCLDDEADFQRFVSIMLGYVASPGFDAERFRQAAEARRK